MALLSDMVAICAENRVDAEPTLTLFARRLREAGRISKAGRGPSAAQMTALDAARFLIACAATDRPERAAEAEAIYSSLVLTRRQPLQSDHGIGLHAGDTLDVALAKMLTALSSPDLRARRAGRKRADLLLGRGSDGAGSWLTIERSNLVARLALLGREFQFSENRANLVHAEFLATKWVGKHLTAELGDDVLMSMAGLLVPPEVEQ